MAKGKFPAFLTKSKGKNAKAEAAEVKKLGAKGAAREEKNESPAERRREAKGK
jgi:hypothetical protein